MAGASDRNMPTVIVARTPREGRERDFEHWLRTLASAAQNAPGHVRSEVQPPTEVHPGEWVNMYQFGDASSLERWLTSPERDALMADGQHLLVGSEREQVFALAQERDPVTAVASFRVADGNEHRSTELHERLVGRLSSFPGFLRSELFEPVDGVQPDTVVVFSFDSRPNLDRWLDSDERRATLAEIDEFSEDHTLNVVGGFGGWFAEPGTVEVTRWKQALVVLIAVFPTSLLLGTLRYWLAPDLPFVASVFLSNVLGVIILSWVLMPRLTKLLSEWLRR